jgi:hypothetical protein
VKNEAAATCGSGDTIRNLRDCPVWSSWAVNVEECGHFWTNYKPTKSLWLMILDWIFGTVPWHPVNGNAVFKKNKIGSISDSMSKTGNRWVSARPNCNQRK